MNENKLITPRKLQGFWELMPKEQMCFSALLNDIESVFKANCFVPLDTPVLEYSEALLAKSGGETDKQVFRFNKGDTDMCMRYDLTVPLARFVAMHKEELSFPFKRYQIGKVYRGERPQKGRFREFYQCDADIIGDGELSVVADAECVSLFEKCFKKLNVDVTIKVSNRKILSGFIEQIQKTDKSNEILTALDKLDKLSSDDVKNILTEIGLSEKNSEEIIKLTKICGKIEEIESILRNFCKNNLFVEGVEELVSLDNYLKNMGTENVIYDLKVIRGHDYYTGTVFEGFLKGKEVAVGGGGRFENLCSYFSKQKMPGVGMSVGITRLFDILREDGYFNSKSQNEIDVAIINFDETLPDALAVCRELRGLNVKADVLYENKSFKSKMKEANRREIPYVIIVGEDEVKSKQYALKNMKTSTQSNLTIQQIAETIKNDRM